MNPPPEHLSAEQLDGLVEFLGQYVTEARREKIETVLGLRTRRLALALEDIYQPHNASACLRSCECLGIQDVHVVEKRHEYAPNKEVSMGASKWLTLRQHAETADCVAQLRAAGYRIVATSPHAGPAGEPHTLATLPLAGKTAIWFGTEEHGLSDEALALADDRLCLPMFGFTESYNISVCVALTMGRLAERLREEDASAWELDQAERQQLRHLWYRKIVKNGDVMERAFLATNS